MRVVSGAGEFEITFERLEVRSGAMVVIGKMGVWEAETFVERADLATLTRLSARPRVLAWIAGLPFAALSRWWRRLSGSGSKG